MDGDILLAGLGVSGRHCGGVGFDNGVRSVTVEVEITQSQNEVAGLAAISWRHVTCVSVPVQRHVA